MAFTTTARIGLRLAFIWVALMLIMSVQAQQQCGAGASGQKCGNGNCCSKFGYCGKTSDYCDKGKGCQTAYGTCSGCFPGSAMVMTRNGIHKRISQLTIGEQVAVWTKKGEVEYDDVYAHGHLDEDSLSEFVVLTLRNVVNPNVTKTLELTPDHFTIVATGNDNMQVQYKRAKDVSIGDKMFATHHLSRVSSFVVSDIKKETLRGLYNPFTIRGTLLVNDVAASCHSQWFLDSAFDRLNLPHLLPSVYQAMLSPIRMLYETMGKDAYKALYDRMDSRFDVAASGTSFRGYFKLLGVALSSNSYTDINA